jgi:hypothetical protein
VHLAAGAGAHSVLKAAPALLDNLIHVFVTDVIAQTQYLSGGIIMRRLIVATTVGLLSSSALAQQTSQGTASAPDLSGMWTWTGLPITTVGMLIVLAFADKAFHRALELVDQNAQRSVILAQYQHHLFGFGNLGKSGLESNTKCTD